MKALWRLLIALYVKAPIYKRVPWTNEDKTTLYLFLQSGCGKRFTLRLREAAADVSFGSIYGKKDAVSAAGYARGFCDCLGLVFRLAESFPTLESEYEAADQPTLPGEAKPRSEQGWQGTLAGGGGAIAP